MIDLSKQEVKLVFNHLNKFLKNFEFDQLEYNFWNKFYSLDELKIVQQKLKTILEKNA